MTYFYNKIKQLSLEAEVSQEKDNYFCPKYCLFENFSYLPRDLMKCPRVRGKLGQVAHRGHKALIRVSRYSALIWIRSTCWAALRHAHDFSPNFNTWTFGLWFQASIWKQWPNLLMCFGTNLFVQIKTSWKFTKSNNCTIFQVVSQEVRNFPRKFP